MTRAWATIGGLGIFMLLLGGTAFAGSVEINPTLKGADLELAKKVKTALDAKLKECRPCTVKIDVKDGVADLSGEATPEQVQGIRDLKVPGVKSVKAGGLKTTPGTDVATKSGEKVAPGMQGGGSKTAHEKTIEAVSTHVAKQGADRKKMESMPGSPPSR